MYFILANTRMTPGPQEGIKVWVGGKGGGGKHIYIISRTNRWADFHQIL